MWIYSQAHHSQASWFTSHVLLEFWYEKWMLHGVTQIRPCGNICPVSSNVAGKPWNQFQWMFQPATFDDTGGSLLLCSTTVVY